MNKLLKEFIKQIILEDLPPTETQKSKLWFHGCPKTEFANSIIRNGFLEQNIERSQYKSQIDEPRKGMVYITDVLEIAIGYAKEDSGDPTEPIGYIFVIRGEDLQDVEPDEDIVSTFLWSFFNGYPIPEQNWLEEDIRNIVLKYFNVVYPDGKIYNHSLKTDKFINKEQIAEANHEELFRLTRYKYAIITKLLLDEFSKNPEKMRKLIDLLKNVNKLAHRGIIYPIACYSFKKSNIFIKDVTFEQFKNYAKLEWTKNE